ncbi:MAG: hypothetical protein KF864_14315 [Phycisphaeraceae bacterium]|nr:hypothetical protein [Phycisphaeraceae bacterium]
MRTQLCIALAAACAATIATASQPSPKKERRVAQFAAGHGAQMRGPVIDSSWVRMPWGDDENGRLWVGRPIIGGVTGSVRENAEDGAASYGAYGMGRETIVVRVPGMFAFEQARYGEIRPWEPVRTDNASPYSNAFTRVHSKMARRLEEARQDWLKENNFVGGVRTFVNDAALLAPATHASGARPEPRGVIELAPDTPRFKSRMRVQAPVPHRRAQADRATSVVRVLPRDSAPAVQAAPAPAQDEKPAKTTAHADRQP